MVVPSVNIDLNLLKLGDVVTKLQQRGIVLADKLLTGSSKRLNNIAIVIGSESSFAFPITTKVIGELDDPSVILDTPEGAMLEGSLTKLYDNLTAQNPYQGTEPSVSARAENQLAMGPALGEVEGAGNESICTTFCSTFYQEGEGYVSDTLIQKAGDAILNSFCTKYLHNETIKDESEVALNERLTEFVLNNVKQEADGRLQMPILWNSSASHCLGRNFNLAKQVLMSNLKKLRKHPEYLQMTNDVFVEQEQLGIIERIPNLNQFLEEHPSHSFLPHMSVLRPDHASTKCRVVYLSNLCEKSKDGKTALCHNQAMYPGPNLNSKLTVALLLLRFDRNVVIFDLKKAFLNITLGEVDQARLLLLWFKDITRENFEIVAFKSKRLPFGISCSPAILMLALYKILILDCVPDSEFAPLLHLVYSLFYMDNGGYTTNTESELWRARDYLVEYFATYGFQLQQFASNSESFQRDLDKCQESATDEIVKLFGIQWHRLKDNLFAKPVHLDPMADCKRKILGTIAENFDPFLFQGPLLNRAKLFLHKLQIDQLLSWDCKLIPTKVKEWSNICKQVNETPAIPIKRFVGKRNDSYQLICFSDSSKLMYGAVIYIQNLETSEVSFVLARNKIITRTLETKSMPSLELNAVVFGLDIMMELYRDLAPKVLLCSINIKYLQLYTDSVVVLGWINGFTNKMESQSKLSVFVRNRLDTLSQLCKHHSVEFKFVSGDNNPADQLTREVSYKLLMKSNYYCGLKFLTNIKLPSIMSVTFPCPDIVTQLNTAVQTADGTEFHLIPLNMYSSFAKLVRIFRQVLVAVHKLKSKVNCNSATGVSNAFKTARESLIKPDQKLHFKECLDYFDNPKDCKMPNLVKQLNLFVDGEGLLRVRSKFGSKEFKNKSFETVLLSRDRRLTRLIISDLHSSMNHSGKYAVLTELRKQFYFPRFFSVVKSVIQSYTHCKRFNNRTVQVNQSPYRETRVSPNVPFRYMYLDHLGPMSCKINNSK